MARNGSPSSSSKSSSSAKSSSSSKSSSSPSSKASLADAARADQKTSTTLDHGGGKKTESGFEESVATARVTEAPEKEKKEKLVEDKREKKQDEKLEGDIDAIDDRAYYRNKLWALYKKVNPDRLDDIDTLLDKYRGRENELYLGVCDKYKCGMEGDDTGSKKDGQKKKKKDATTLLTLRPRERKEDPSPTHKLGKINLQEGPSVRGSSGPHHADRRQSVMGMGPNNTVAHAHAPAHAHAHQNRGTQNHNNMHGNNTNSMFPPAHNIPHGFSQAGNNPHQFPVRPFFMPRQGSMHQQQPMIYTSVPQNMRLQPHPMNPSHPEAVYRAHGSGLHPSPPPPRPAYAHNHNSHNAYEVFNTPEEYGEYRREEKLRGRSRVNLSATRRKRPKAKLLPKPELRKVVMSERIGPSGSDGRLLRRRRNVDCDLRTKPTKIPDDEEEDVEEKYCRNKTRIVRRTEKEQVRRFGKQKGRSRRIIEEYVQDLDEDMEDFVDLDVDDDEDEDEQEVIELLEEMKAQRAVAAARKKGQKKKQPCILKKKVVKKPVVLKPSLKHTKGVILKKQSLQSSKMHLGVGKSTKVVKKMTIDKSSRDALKKKKGTTISSATGAAGGELKKIKTLRSTTQLENKVKKKSNSSNEALGAAAGKPKLKPKVKRKTAFPLKSDQNDEEDLEDYDDDDLKRNDDGSFRKAPNCEGSSALFQDSTGTPVSHSRHRPRTTSEAIVGSKKAKKTLKNENEPERKGKKTLKPRPSSNATERSNKSLELGKKREKSLKKHSKGRHPSPKKQEKGKSSPLRRSKSSKTGRGEKKTEHSSKMTKPKLVLRKNKKPRKEKSKLRSRSRNQLSRNGSADDDLQRDSKGRNEKRGMKSSGSLSGSRSGSLPESLLFQDLRSRSLGLKDKKGKRKKKAARSMLSSESRLSRKKLKDHERQLLQSKSYLSSSLSPSSSSSLAKDKREKGHGISKKSRSRSSRLSHVAHKEQKRGRDATKKKSPLPSSSSSSSSSSKTTSGPSTLRDDDSHVSTSSAAPRRGRNAPLSSKRRSASSKSRSVSCGHQKESHSCSRSRSRPKRSLSSFRRGGLGPSPDRRSNKSALPRPPHRRDGSRTSSSRRGDQVRRTRGKSERRRKRTSSPLTNQHGPREGRARDDGSLSPSQATRKKPGRHHHEPRARLRSLTPFSLKSPEDQKQQPLSPRRRFNRHESPPRNHTRAPRTRCRSPPPSNIAPLAFRNNDRDGRNVSSTSGPRSRSDRDKKNARRDHQPRGGNTPNASLRRGGERSRSDRRRARPLGHGGSRGHSPMRRRSRSFRRQGGRMRPRGR